jgi:hypothetical protein
VTGVDRGADAGARLAPLRIVTHCDGIVPQQSLGHSAFVSRSKISLTRCQFAASILATPARKYAIGRSESRQVFLVDCREDPDRVRGFRPRGPRVDESGYCCAG